MTNQEMVNLRDVAKAIRSKNAKSFHLTLDIFFKDERVYQRVRDAGVVSRESIQALYSGLDMTEFVWFDPGQALKVTFRRPQSVGSPGDVDVFGCQQHAPLYAIELPANVVYGDDNVVSGDESVQDDIGGVLVIGSALRDVCGDQKALGLKFREAVQTAPRYRLFVVEERFAALVRDEANGVAISGELVDVNRDRWNEIVADEPEGISFGAVELSDGRRALAAVGDEARLRREGLDISEYGGFSAYWSAMTLPPAV